MTRERLVLPSLMFVAMVTGIVGSLGAPVIPEIAAAESVPLRTAQWSLTAALLVSAVATPIVGRLGGGRRRKPVIVGVLALVSVGHLLAALPLGIGALIAGRALQGIGLGIGPLVFSVARDVLPPARQRSAVSAITVATVVAAGLGFPVTSVTAEIAGVKGAFWLGFALTVTALVAAVLLVPGQSEQASGRVDLVGAMLLGAPTFLLLLAITQADHWGYASPATLGSAAVAVLLLVLCVRWLRRAATPLVDLSLASHPAVAATHVAAGLAGCAMYLAFALSMVLLQTPDGEGFGLGYPVAVAGFMMLPYAAFSIVGNRLALRFGPILGPDLVLPVGCLIYAAANLVFLTQPGSFAVVLVLMVLSGLGSGTTFNSIPWLMMRFVPPAETGSAMSLNMVMRYLGFSLGSALGLAALQGFADEEGPTELGYRVGAAAGTLIGIAAAVVCLVLARAAARRAPAYDGGSLPAPTATPATPDLGGTA